MTSYLPEQDRYSQSKQYLLSRISSLFAGRIAEELAFGPDAVTTGASNDIERATDIARRMITRWGFSKRLPPMQFDQDQDQSQYLGGGHVSTLPVSDQTTKIIDEEVSEIINSCYDRAKKMLTENRDILEAMKDALLKYETIDANQIDDLMNRRPCRPSGESKDQKSSSSNSNSGTSSNSDAGNAQSSAQTQGAQSTQEQSQSQAQASTSDESKASEAQPTGNNSQAQSEEYVSVESVKSQAEAQTEAKSESAEASNSGSSSDTNSSSSGQGWPYNTPSGRDKKD